MSIRHDAGHFTSRTPPAAARSHRLALVCHAGLLAQWHGMDARADAIFRAVRPCLADPAALDVSRALVFYRLGDLRRAEQVLTEDLLATAPDHEIAIATLGLVMRDAGRRGWRERLERVLAIGISPQARRIAQTALAA